MVTARTRLRVVAYLFAVWGLLAVVNMFRPVNGKIQLSFSSGLICIPIAFGLFALRPLWRKVALVILGVSLVLVVVVVALVVFQWSSIRVEPFLGLSGTPALIVYVVLMVTSTILSIWSIRVLRSSPVRELFGEGSVRAA